MAPFPLEMDGTVTSGKGTSRQTSGSSLVCYHGMPDLDLLWPREGLNAGLSCCLSQILPQRYHRWESLLGSKSQTRNARGRRAGTLRWWDHWP